MAITFRTDDNTRWGVGQGSDLAAEQIDINFWELYSSVVALQDHAALQGPGIDFFNTVGQNLYVHMTDHSVLGPYLLPVAQWNFRGPWAPLTFYSVMDVVNGPDGGVYVVIFEHTSAATFDPGANDGLGHDFYAALLSPPASLMPAGGTIAQRLAKIDSTDYNTQWVNDPIRIALYIDGIPTSGETVLVYNAVDTFTIPAGFNGSFASSGIAAFASVSYNVLKNGSSIGTVNWAASATVATFNLTSDVVFVPGDVLKITAPATVDVTQDNIGITLVGFISA